MTKPLSSFYSKMALTLVLIFVTVGLLISWIALGLTQTYQDEVEQELHHELAHHVVKDNQLLANGKIDKVALKNTFHSMMILGPSFEFYVLDPFGKILTYSADPEKIKRQSVDLHPVKDFLQGDVMLPIVGDDPRSTYRQKIFSAAKIIQDGKLEGYLYIIIGGEIYDDVVGLFQNSHIMNIGFISLSMTLIFSLLAVLIIFTLLTRPLRRLIKDISTFREQGFAEHTVDLTHWQKDSRDDIQRLGSTFNEMALTLKEQYEKVKTTDELRRELISYVSHDLRTPLAALSGYLETWQLKHPRLSTEESQKLIEVAQSNCSKVNQLVDQLFELAHLDGVNVPLNLEPVSITELIHDVLQKLELSAHDKGVSLDLEPKDPSLIVRADIEKLERALSNLIDNAIRHCEHKDKVLARVTRTADRYKVEIIDSGCGIPEEELPRIFDAHYRAKNSAQGKRLHSGLGLAITRRILELHGSEIKVESQAGYGCKFYFELPANESTSLC